MFTPKQYKAKTTPSGSLSSSLQPKEQFGYPETEMSYLAPAEQADIGSIQDKAELAMALLDAPLAESQPNAVAGYLGAAAILRMNQPRQQATKHYRATKLH